MNKVNDLDKKLSNGVLLFYGYSYENIPNEIKRNNDFGVEFFFNEKDQKNKIKHNIKTQRYNGFQDIGLKDSDIVFFDQSAVKGLLIGYPANAKYVLVNLANLRYMPWIILGFFRRIILRKITFNGIKRLTENNKSSYWIVLKRRTIINNNDFYLSEDVGISGFLKYLYEANIEYVIPRHYEFLPNLHRVGGDLDIIVSDKDEESLKKFLLENDGSIRIDVWSVSRKNYNKTSYMPPNIAKKIINDSVEGKALSKIPNQLDSFNCLVFHALYHKGFNSEIPSKYKTSNKIISNNDYFSAIKNKASELNLEIHFTMESLDDYMNSIGWRPSTKTLKSLSKENEWIRLDHFN